MRINESIPLFNVSLSEPVTVGDKLKIYFKPGDVLCLEDEGDQS
jgi:hypothetical protein